MTGYGHPPFEEVDFRRRFDMQSSARLHRRLSAAPAASPHLPHESRNGRPPPSFTAQPFTRPRAPWWPTERRNTGTGAFAE